MMIMVMVTIQLDVDNNLMISIEFLGDIYYWTGENPNVVKAMARMVQQHELKKSRELILPLALEDNCTFRRSVTFSAP